MKTKTCSVCGVVKQVTEFYLISKSAVKRQYRPHCKLCHNTRATNARIANLAAYLIRERQRNVKSSTKATVKRYAQSAKGKAVATNCVVKWQTKNPDKVRAHRLVRSAIRRGELVRPDVCDCCGERGRVQAHHDDYTKPLSVRWLLPKCHIREHGRASMYRQS